MILSQKRVLVVGVRNRRSLAHGIATAAATQGAQLAFAVQPGEKSFDKTSRFINADFPDSAVIPCDAGQDDDVATAVNTAVENLGGLDGVVHAIAFAQRETIMGDYHEGISRAAFCEALDISAYTLTAFAKAAHPHLQAAGGGSVITLSYLGAERALPSYNVMGVAKSALESSVRYLAYGLGRDGVRVNALSAGPVKTLAAAGIGDFGKILKVVAEQAPLKRNITTDEVGDAAAFLLSDLSRGITGEVIHVDAGFHITAGFPDPEPAPDEAAP